jgi:hypothetical protein
MRRQGILGMGGGGALPRGRRSRAGGTYDVVSCGAPGAGGVNRAWVGEIVPSGSPYSIANCGSELLGATSSAKQRAGYFTGANWTFTAPAGTTITRLVTWRLGQRFCCNGWGVGHGRWAATYGFSGRPGAYPVRVRIRRQADFPFVLGRSRAVRIAVR